MNYTYLDLLCYLFIYSFLGWVTEVLIITFQCRQLRNRGFFNLPLCLSYGITMNLLILIIPTMEGNIVMEYLAALAVSSVVTYISGTFSKRISRTTLWNYEENNLFSGEKRPFLLGLLQGLIFLLAVLLLHPLVFVIISLIPQLIKRIFCLVICVLLIGDLILILATLRKNRSQEEIDELMYQSRTRKHRSQEDIETLMNQRQTRKRRLGERITDAAWKRIYKAYPNMNRMESPSAERAVFAQGICLDKLVWVFLIMSVFGVLFETFFVWLTTGVLMSRASFIYGPFSVVWGFGAVILTIVLERLSGKEDRYAFFAGCFIGGIYEYMCSVISEVFFGTTFWDYSDMPLNFGGRTNLLFCLFWGILSVWWVKWAYPLLNRYIERIPPITGKVVTWVILVFLFLDGLLSAAALLRYVDRITNPAADTFLAVFLDQMYPDSFLEQVWPNLRLTN